MKKLTCLRGIAFLLAAAFLCLTSLLPAQQSRIVCIDPGHQLRGDSSQEPIGPGAKETKNCVTSGTSGKIAGPEHGVNLAVGLELRDILTSQGVTVVMTREVADVRLCNSERAAIANRAKADLCIRLHCDAGSAHNCFTLYPEKIAGWTDDICDESLKAAKIVQAAYARHTGLPDAGVIPRKDLSGFNWSDVPVILPEMLHMQNEEDDRRASTPEFRRRMAEGLALGIKEYLKTLEAKTDR